MVVMSGFDWDLNFLYEAVEQGTASDLEVTDNAI